MNINSTYDDTLDDINALADSYEGLDGIDDEDESKSDNSTDEGTDDSEDE